MIDTLQAEFLKCKNSNVVWLTFFAFALAPIMGGFFILILRQPELMNNGSALSQKAAALGFAANTKSYIDLLTQAVGVGGVLLFGFVASWVFGREYSDGTVKDLLALPTSRSRIIQAKFILYIIWCLALAISNLLTMGLICLVTQLETSNWPLIFKSLAHYFLTFILTIQLGFPVAFVALLGRGYLAPLGFVAITLVLSQIIAASGLGHYFPWSIPGLYSGIGGEMKHSIHGTSFTILLLTALTGYVCTIKFWQWSDFSK